jgi:hypothetical protein
MGLDIIMPVLTFLLRINPRMASLANKLDNAEATLAQHSHDFEISSSDLIFSIRASAALESPRLSKLRWLKWHRVAEHKVVIVEISSPV